MGLIDTYDLELRGTILCSLEPDGDPIRLGRAPENDLVFTDPTVSWHHALFVPQNNGIWVQDLGSTNGCFIDGKRVVRSALAIPGNRIRLGSDDEIVLSMGTSEFTESDDSAWLLQDAASGACRSPIGGRLRIGSDPSCDIRLDMAEPVELVDRGARVELISGGDSRLLEIGDEIPLGDHLFRLVHFDRRRENTLPTGLSGLPYRLEIWLSAPRGPRARLTCQVTSRRCEVTSELRVVLLYQLARRAKDDCRSHLSAETVGWCNDQDLAVGLWGKTGASNNRLNVLLHRLRRQIEQDSLDPSFIERQSKTMRLTLADIRIED